MKNLPFLLLILFTACGQPTTNDQKEINTKEVATPIIEKKETIPLPSYKVINQDYRKPIKATFNLRLEKQISESEITAIAKHLKSSNPDYTRYFIFYYLPDMEVGKGAWATSHFNTSLNVNILGLSSEEEEKLNSVEMPKGKIIGKWFDNSPASENTIIIYQKGGKYLFRQIYKDGSFGDQKVSKKGNVYKYKNNFGEYLKIESDGNLGWYDKTGRFLIAKKMK